MYTHLILTKKNYLMKTINALKIGNSVTVSIDGKLYKRVCDNAELAKKVFNTALTAKNNPTDENVNNILGLMNERTRIAMECGLEFNPDTAEVFMAGFNTPVPNTLVEIVKEYHENGYPLEAILNFWSLLMLNPDKRVRESLFDFINTHDFAITDKGYMITYKAVGYKTKQENDLAEFVSNSYVRVKTAWKTNPSRYVIYRDLETEMVYMTKEETYEGWDEKEKNVVLVGNLKDLYDNLSLLSENSKTVYESKYYRSKMEIKLGVPVRQARNECDADPRNDCSNGLHVGATRYVESFGDNGDAILICYVNPANVVAVPDYEHSKIRVTEYFPFAVANYVDRKIEIIEQSFMESDYSEYEIDELEMLLEDVLEQEGERVMGTAMNALEESRDRDEILRILESRVSVVNM